MNAILNGKGWTKIATLKVGESVDFPEDIEEIYILVGSESGINFTSTVLYDSIDGEMQNRFGYYWSENNNRGANFVISKKKITFDKMYVLSKAYADISASIYVR